MQIEARIKELAASLNLPLCGIATPQLDSRHFERFERWVRNGAAADMEYLTRETERRRSIHNVMPDARAVIVFGLPYFSRSERPAGTEPLGRISQYATGRDYHRVLEKKLKEIILRVPELATAQNRIYVDYGPLLERAYAQSAGLGFIGKNNCLINSSWGSFFFIGVIATSLELAPDKPLAHDCGDCRACLDACPTGALAEAYHLDARRCISFHSVENGADIPPEIRERWRGGWIMGCDACQNACPHNRNIPETPEPECGELKIAQYVPLTDFLMGDESSFLKRFEASPLRRAGYAGIQRNCVVAAAHCFDKQTALALLEKTLAVNVGNEMLRRHIEWAVEYVKNRSGD